MGECFGVENLDDAASAIDDSCSFPNIRRSSSTKPVLFLFLQHG